MSLDESIVLITVAIPTFRGPVTNQPVTAPGMSRSHESVTILRRSRNHCVLLVLLCFLESFACRLLVFIDVELDAFSLVSVSLRGRSCT